MIGEIVDSVRREGRNFLANSDKIFATGLQLQEDWTISVSATACMNVVEINLINFEGELTLYFFMLGC